MKCVTHCLYFYFMLCYKKRAEGVKIYLFAKFLADPLTVHKQSVIQAAQHDLWLISVEK